MCRPLIATYRVRETERGSAALAWGVALPRCSLLRWGLARGGRGSSPGLALLGFPEDLGDLLDLGKQLLCRLDVDGALGAAGACQLGGLVEQGVQLRVLLEVRRLEVVGPQHPQVVLDKLGALLLDDDRASPESRVLIGGVLFRDRLDGLRLDQRLGG